MCFEFISSFSSRHSLLKVLIWKDIDFFLFFIYQNTALTFPRVHQIRGECQCYILGSGKHFAFYCKAQNTYYYQILSL